MLKRSLKRWVVFLFVLSVGAGLAFSTQSGGGVEPIGQKANRADVITIDGLKAFRSLELPPVYFQHDIHTDALEKQNKDCSVCHPVDKERSSLKFKRMKDNSRQEVMDIYHDQCLACHRVIAATREKAGPLACLGCRVESSPVCSNRQPLVVNKSLHFRHTRALEDKCEKCHHEYDNKAMKLVYIKEKEGSCKYCHLEQTQENRSSMRLASHIGCIDCHKKILAEKKKAGPLKCAGCHDPLKQKAMEKVDPVPRIKRNQPDLLLVKTTNPEPGIKTVVLEKPLKMNPVPFDHKAHEEYNDTCRVCHHASLDSCAKCHTLGGAKDGKFVQLERSMHVLGEKSSCQGCHETKQGQKQCAGCHYKLNKTKSDQEEAGCRKCHMAAGPVQPEGAPPLTPQAELTFVSEQLGSRKFIDDTININDLPEKILIRVMEDQYHPADFPHRKIVQTLLDNMKDSKLAGFFHSNPETMCQGCHHHSPASKTPPRCWNCHSQPIAEKGHARPGMKAAYHLQCMGCHKEMKLEKPMSTVCNSCHEEKKK
ncbi:MAG: cytochrome C [Deltaproteobacteria bacterium]|nr:cytochrome C [Deltaproteobacteria bacterium]